VHEGGWQIVRGGERFHFMHPLDRWGVAGRSPTEELAA
jgi:hypothetical protein